LDCSIALLAGDRLEHPPGQSPVTEKTELDGFIAAALAGTMARHVAKWILIGKQIAVGGRWVVYEGIQ